MCSILKNQNCLNYLNEKKQSKEYLMQMLSCFVIRHKNEKNFALKKMTKTEKIPNENFIIHKEQRI